MPGGTTNRKGGPVKRLLVLLGLIAVGVAVIRSRQGAEVWHSVDDHTDG
ncbi:hypothetical protein BH10ACT9_BH10ACT9_19060 [soil metagenome]